jgi:hypothetical protein
MDVGVGQFISNYAMISLIGDGSSIRRPETCPRTLIQNMMTPLLRLASQPVIGVPITAAARLSSTKIGKPWRRSNWQRRQCLNVGDNIDDDRTLRLDRPGDRRAKLVWFFDADAERANLFGHAGKINGSKGP